MIVILFSVIATKATYKHITQRSSHHVFEIMVLMSNTRMVLLSSMCMLKTNTVAIMLST